MNRTVARDKKLLKQRGITHERVAREVKRLFPDRTCTKYMVGHVLNGRATSAYVSVAIEKLLSGPEAKAS
jgi:hypothetical protein